MKRLISVLLILVIVVAALAAIISVAASAGQKLSSQNELSEGLEPQSTNDTVLYVKEGGTGNCTSWAEACDLQAALSEAVSGNEIWVAEGIHRPSHGLPLGEMTDFTFVAWINWAGANDWERIFDFGKDTNRYMKLTPRNSSGDMEFSITENGYDHLQIVSGGQIVTNTWVHVAVTLEGDTGRLFVAGTEAVSGTIELDPMKVYGPDAWLGRSHWSHDFYFEGIIDEVAVFNRALSTAEISATFQSGWSNMDGKVLGLHMEEDPAVHDSTIYDSSGLGSHGTLNTGEEDEENKSVAGKINKALEFDGVDDFLELPVHPGDRRSDTFQLKNGVAIYGGFVGGETARSQRNWEHNVAVLSGDLDGDDVTGANGVITDTANISGTNSYHVVTGRSLTETAVLDGFTITGGHAHGGDISLGDGGGMFNYDGSPTLANVTFSGNSASLRGGGMYNENGSPTLTSVDFISNTAESDGGGMYTYGNPTLINVIFSQNEARYEGGGIKNVNDSMLTLVDSMVGPGNNVGYAGGGIANYSTMIITNTTIAGNSGTGTEGGAGIVNQGTLTLTNCTVSDNVTMNFGGGILAGFLSTTILSNCTISGNTADSDGIDGGGGGGIYIDSLTADILVKNSIIAGNGLGESSTTPGPDVYGDFTSLGYNLIGNGSGSTGFADGVNHDQVGSDATPIDPLLGPLTLNPPGSAPTMALLVGSPAIDQGNCSGFVKDQRGALRPVDIPNIEDEDDGCDIGAYEVQLITADFEGSPLSGVAPLAVSFSNLSSGDYDTCAWDFGDEITSDVCDDPEHVYEQAGWYTVSLTVSGAGGEDAVEEIDYIDVSAKLFLPAIYK